MKQTHYLFAVVLIAGLTQFSEAQQIVSATLFSINDRGAFATATDGSPTSVAVGYASIQPTSGHTTPAGLAIFGFRQSNMLISEAGVPASLPTTTGRIYAEVNGPVNTGIAIANPNNQSAVVSFYFTDQTGTNFGAGSTTVAAGGQIARFLNQDPFDGGASIAGTFTFNSNVPIAVVALRGLTNERSEFLLTTLPIDTLSGAIAGTAYFPHFADGGGWTTQIDLVNPTDVAVSGSVQFFGQGIAPASAQPATVTINGQTGSTFPYTIPGRSSIGLKTAGLAPSTAVGSVRVIPSQNSQTPSGLAVFSFRNGNVTVSEAAVPATRSDLAFRLYAESANVSNGSIQTGIAIANPASTAVAVTFELSSLTGLTTGRIGSATIPGNGQIALFLNQITGFESLATTFQGILRISTTAPAGIAVTGLRGRYNERGDFLITTTPPSDEASSASSAFSFFPHLADGGGYTTQFILLSGSAGQTTSGALQLFAQSGQSLTVTLTGPVVPPGPLSAVALDHYGDSVDVGDTLQLSATGKDATGVVLSGRSVVWASSNAQVLIVSSTGLVTGVKAGAAQVTATISNVVGTTTLNVGAVDPYIFTEVGQVLGPSDAGQVPGPLTGTADVSAVELPDKRIRLYFGLFTASSGPGNLGSAISSDSTGTHFSVEPGIRGPSNATPMEGFGSPLVFPLPGGGYRLFYNGCHPGGCGLSSSTSADGLTFVADPGLRFASPITNDQPACGGIAKRPDGTYRIYCSATVTSRVVGTATLTTAAVFSAVSPDLLKWSVEPGFRVGPGAPSLPEDANHPTPIVNEDGSVSIVFYRRPATGEAACEMIANSKDGLTFDSEINTGILGTEPSLLKRADGSLLLYHGNQTPTDGSTIEVTHVVVKPQ